jgi:alpha-1,3-rhamnosyl/mannosyltransferase
MASGIPVVCSNSSSLPEVAGGAALLVDPLNTDAWAAALSQVLEDEGLRAEMIEQGVLQAARFDWVRSASQLLGVMESLVAERSGDVKGARG